MEMDQKDVRQMNDKTLVASWALVSDGRQYEGVADDKEMIASEMAERLSP